jgi:transcription elongation factor GreA
MAKIPYLCTTEEFRCAGFFFVLNSLSMSNLNYITEEGLNKLKEELEQLKSVERPSISRQIAEARDKGDLSENAEYHAAKEAQGMLELKISKLEDMLARSRIVDETRIDTSTVQLLNRIKIRNKKSNATMEYVIVPENEADLKAGKISISSPIARGLLGKKEGDEVEVEVPSGKIPFEIISITR